MNPSPLYSIIIPSHNHSDLLQRCLDSIPDTNIIQVIVVDDNSDSRKVDFEKYPGMERIFTEVIFTKEGKGAGFVRNIGLSKAKGKWVLFADSDDYYNDDLIEMLNSHYNDGYDIIYFDVSSVNSDTLESSNRCLSRSIPINNYRGKKLDYFCRYAYTEPWGKMFKMDFLNKIQAKFSESFVANDYFFSIYTGYYAKSISVDTQKLYCVTERKSSLSNSFIGDEIRIKARLSEYFKVQTFYDSHKIKLIPFYEFCFDMYRRGSSTRLLAKDFMRTHNLNIANVICRYLKNRMELVHNKIL